MSDKAAISKLKQEENSAFRALQAAEANLKAAQTEAEANLRTAQREVAEAKDVYYRRRTLRRTAQWMASDGEAAP